MSGPELEQILINLVSNAVDAAPEGRGVVGVELQKEEDDVGVTVSDNGPGIDPALADRIFEPFVSSKPPENGPGLGLAICRRLATSMAAELTASNREQSGAIFTLRVPCPQVSAVRPSPGAAPA